MLDGNSAIKASNYAEERTRYRAGVVALAAVIVYFMFVRMLGAWGAFNGLDSPIGELLISIIWPIAGELALPVLLYYFIVNRKGRKYTSALQLAHDFGYRKPDWMLIGLSVVLGITYTVVNSGIATISQVLLMLFGVKIPGGSEVYGGIGHLVIMLFVTAVLPALCEENLERGIFAYSVKVKGEGYAIGMTALVFALAHMNIGQFFYTFAMGLITGYVVVKTGNILPGIIMHFINNAGNIYLAYAYNKGLPGGGIFAWLDKMLVNDPAVVIFIWIAAFVISIMLASFIVKLHKKKADMHAALARLQNPDQPEPPVPAPYAPNFEDNIPLYAAMILLVGATLLSLMMGLI